MDTCMICNEDIRDGNKTIKLREKGSDGVNNASRERGDTIVARAGQLVHEHCRRSYINPNVIKALKRKSTSPSPLSITPTLRSERQFNFQEDCLFCGNSTVETSAKRKLFDVHAVQTTEFQKTVEQICFDRNDEWATEVRGRIAFARDLHAVDAIYHNSCSTNFRTGKNVPQLFSPRSDKSEFKRGRPNTNHQNFLKVLDFFEENDDEQLTIKDLVDRMTDLCGNEAYSLPYMKQKLKEHYGASILITELNGKENVVTFRQTASNILHNFYRESQQKKSDEESKRFVIKTAAALIKTEIRSMPVEKKFYPSSKDILSHEKHIPESLAVFLKSLFSEKDATLKISSIGQAIMQATRPRLVIEPLQIGLATQIHHMFGSRFLIDTLSNMGFCSSYSEVQKLETSVVIAKQEEINDQLDESHCLQYVADNVDHNITTIDGNNTFHGMGIISCLTPGFEKSPTHIPRLNVTTEELIECGKINIYHYNPDKHKGFTSLKFQELRNLRTMVANNSWKIDILRHITRQLKSHIPEWSGTMQMVQQGSSSGVSDVIFLPMIDLNPSDMNCIYSTLMFVSKEASCQKRTPIITFDQPLYWKAVMITSGQECSNIIVRLGAFHTEMSFLGSIGRIMSGSGLKEILELIYAPNAVTHMLNGKAVSRAVRGFMLVDTALHHLIARDIFWPDATEGDESDNISTEQPLLIESHELYDRLHRKEISLEEVLESQTLQVLQEMLQRKKDELKLSRTSKLWIGFLDMMGILKRFLIAERTGDWLLHLSTIREMLPYLAASGHNFYTKSAYFYLTQMQDLEFKHPNIYAHFMNGNHVIRRSDRFWAGLSTDLVIEQVLMKSLKTTGGLTRGRGMGEAQRALWLLSMPTLAEYNNTMQQVTGAGYKTSDQHIESSKTRIERDNKDVALLIDFLTDRNPFTSDKTLRNIETGMVADSDVNADNAKIIGGKIVESMAGKLVSEISFRKKDQIVTLDAKRSSDSNISHQPQVDPQLMFQRLTAIGQESLINTAELFEYELSSFPSSLFEANGLPRQAVKATLADAIWNMGKCSVQELPEGDISHVVDGGSLLHRLPWIKGQTFSQICMRYVDHIQKRFSNPTIVMDGYNGSTTKDITHLRRTGGAQSNTITFTRDMPLRIKKETFLQNQSNKQRFTEILMDILQEHNIEAIQAEGDADLLIVKTAVDKSTSKKVIVLGEDTDLLILLCHHTEQNSNDIFFTTDKQSSMKNLKVWDIRKTQQVLGEDICKLLPFVHAITGCDTTSRLHGIGKPAVLKKIKSDNHLQTQGYVFLNESVGKDEVCKAGEEALVNFYGGMPLEGLDILRWRTFTTKTMASNRSSVVQVQTLPPTSDAAKFHSLRVYLQCQYWKGKTHEEIDPLQWGWTVKNNNLFPIQMSKLPAPEFLLKTIHCNCKTDCDNRRCSCRKNCISCSSGCGECKGINCSNCSKFEPDEIDSDELEVQEI